MRKIILLSVMVFTLLTVAGFANEFTHNGAGISIWFPDTWTVSADDENYIFAEDPAGEAGIVYIIFDASEIEAKIDAMDKELGDLVDNLEFTSDIMTEDEINGMKVLGITATGTSGGIPVTLGIVLIAAPSEKVLMIIAMIGTEYMDKHEETLDQMLKAIKPL